MPKPKLIDKYPMGLVEKSSDIIASIITEFLSDSLSPEEVKQLLLDINQPRQITASTEEFDNMYNNLTVRDVIGDQGEGFDYSSGTSVTHVLEGGREEPIPTHHMESMDQFYHFSDIDGVNKLIKNHINTAKKVQKLLKQQMDGMQTEAQKQYAGFFMEYLDRYIEGSFVKKMQDNPGWAFSYLAMNAYITNDSPAIIPDRKDNGPLEITVFSNPGNWKKNVEALKGSSLLETISRSCKLNKIIEEASNNGPAEREKLLEEYEAIKNSYMKVRTITEEEYDRINTAVPGHTVFQNNIGEFTDSPRTGTYTADDAEGRIEALKSGYPVQDLQTLSQYYMAIKAAERDIEKSNKTIRNLEKSNKSKEEIETLRQKENAFIAKNQEILDTLQPAWQNAMDGNHKTQEERMHHLQNMNLKMLDLVGKAEKNLKGTFIGSAVSRGIIIRQMNQAQQRKLSLQEIAFMSGKPKDIMKVIEEVDPKKVSSSSEFKKMKEAVEKLSKINADKYPEKYDLQKARSIRATQDYLRYKEIQLNDPAKPHKRSDLEQKRVNAAGNVLSCLLGGKNPDLLNDKLGKEPSEMIYNEDEPAFKADCMLMFGWNRRLLKDLNDMKIRLIESQKDKDKNFTNTKKMEGSETYRRMTQALQNSIDILEDMDANPSRVKESLEELDRRCRDYQKEHDSIFKGNYGNKLTARQNQAQKAMKLIPKSLLTYDKIRMKLSEYKNEKGKPCGYISLNSLTKYYKDNVDEIHGNIRKDYVDDPTNARLQIMDEDSSIKVKLKEKLAKKHPDIAENYAVYRDPVYYMSVIKDNSVESMAKAIAVKNMMDTIFKEKEIQNDLMDSFHEGDDQPDLDMIETEIDGGCIEREAEKLAKDPVFKMVVKNYPNTAFQKWSTINDEIENLQMESRNRLEELESRQINGQKPANIGEAIFENSNGNMFTSPESIARVMVDSIMANQQGKGIASLIAAAPKQYKENMLEAVQTVATQYIKGVIDKNPNKYKNNENDVQGTKNVINELINDAEISNKLKNHLLKSQKKVLTKADEIKTRKAVQKQADIMM